MTDDITSALGAAAPSRRTLIRGLTIGGVLAASGIRDGVAGEAATTTGSLPTSVDVVVVGGGLPTRRCPQASSSGQVGRSSSRRAIGSVDASSTTSCPAALIEAGGTSSVRRRTTFSGWPRRSAPRRSRSTSRGRTSTSRTGNRPSGSPETVPPDLLTLADAALLQAQIDQMAGRDTDRQAMDAQGCTGPDPSRSTPGCVRTRVLPQVRTLFLSYLQPTFGSDGLDVSMLFFLWYIAEAGNETHAGTFERSSDTAGGAQDSRFVRQPDRPAALARTSAMPSRSTAPVRKISQSAVRDRHERPRHRARQARHRRVPSAHCSRHRLVTSLPPRAGSCCSTCPWAT